MNNINPMRNFWTLLFLIIFLFVLGCNLGWFDKTKHKDFCEKFKFSSYSSSSSSSSCSKPDRVIVYQPGTYTFSLKAGEKTDHWIQLPKDVYYGVKSPDDQFSLLYYDGEKVPAWTPGNWPNKSKFKMIAQIDQIITLLVYK